MDATHIHLLLNHIPILGSLFALCLLLYGLIRKNASLEQAGLVTFVIAGLFALPVFFSGEDAEDAVEKLAGVSEFFIEEHEDLALIALWAIIVTAVLSLIGLYTYHTKKRSVPLRAAIVIAAIVSFAMMTLTGSHGGKIRHSEIRGTDLSNPTNQNVPENKGERDDD